MTTIPAIETHYAGCRFRSRLEARWAVFFDRAGIAWQYEPQGYQIDVAGEKRPYLPDFWLPDVDGGTWCEVKGSPEGMDIPLLAHAAHGEHGLPGLDGKQMHPAKRHRLLILGPIPDEDEHLTVPLHCCLTWNPRDPQPGVYATNVLLIGGAIIATDLSSPVLGPDDTIYGSRDNLWRSITGEVRIPFVAMPIFYRAARQARFEHGETPDAA